MNPNSSDIESVKIDPSLRSESSSILALESLAKSTLDEAALQILAAAKKAGEVIRKNPIATAAVVAILGYAVIRLASRDSSPSSKTLHH